MGIMYEPYRRVHLISTSSRIPRHEAIAEKAELIAQLYLSPVIMMCAGNDCVTPPRSLMAIADSI